MKIKTMQYHYIPRRMAKMKETDGINYYDVDQLEVSYTASGSTKWCNHWETV